MHMSETCNSQREVAKIPVPETNTKHELAQQSITDNGHQVSGFVEVPDQGAITEGTHRDKIEEQPEKGSVTGSAEAND